MASLPQKFQESQLPKPGKRIHSNKAILLNNFTYAQSTPLNL